MAFLGGVDIGNLTLEDVDAPEDLGFSEKLNDKEDVLSDGTRRLEIAGYTQNDITLTGTMSSARGGSPLARMDAMRRMLRAGQPVALHYKQYRYNVIVRAVDPRIQLLDWVQYSLTLFIGRSGALPRGAAALPVGSSGLRNATRAGAGVASAASSAETKRPRRMR